jgi:pyruvate/2-oxoglutarate dehydrogenase complex dihydrolipoamide acyltransferase (E2) component
MYPPTHEGHLHQKYSRYSTEYFPIGVRLYEQASRPDAGKGADAKGRSPKKAKAAPAPAATAPTATAPTPAAPAAPAPAAGNKWAEKEPLQVRAMVLAGDVLFVAGWMDAVAIQPKSGAPVGAQSREEGPAALWAVSPADGSILARYKLDASPAWDGMFAARGNLYLVLKNGTVLCLGAEETRK